MPKRCAVYGCGSVTDAKEGISMHTIPFFGDDRPEAVKRRKRWVDFVSRTRAKWEPSKSSYVCSKHFKPDDYEQPLASSSSLPEFSETFLKTLKHDSFGKSAFPSIYPAVNTSSSTSTTSSYAGQDTERSRRHSRRSILKEVGESSTVSTSPADEMDTESDTSQIDTTQEEPITETSMELPPPFRECSTQTEEAECKNCTYLSSEVKRLRNLWTGARKKLEDERRLRKQLSKVIEKGKTTSEKHAEEDDDDDEEEEEKDEQEEEVEEGEDIMDQITSESDHFIPPDDEYQFSDDVDLSQETSSSSSSGNGKPYNVKTEPKFIVFLSQLLLLFQVCPTCKCDGVSVEWKTLGTMVEVVASCVNQTCPKNIWKSQPQMPGTDIPAGNFLTSFATLMSGSLAVKIINVFRHIGLCCTSIRTYYRHQRSLIFPSIFLHWKRYQETMLEKIDAKEKLDLAGDARHDSMGHNAKYGVYTIFYCNNPMILHFELVQANEVGSSSAMEYEGFKRAISFMENQQFGLATFVSDRHTSVVKHMRETLPHIVHYFDLWHIKKKVRKQLNKIASQKGCEILKDWVQPCINHLHWSAISTPSGNGQVILAKFNSFLGHIANEHEGHPDPLFNKCAHATITDRIWLEKESDLYDKVESAVRKKSIQKAVKKASPLTQTSCLESFHSVVNQFCPKMIGFSYVGMLCRHALAALHFNSNLNRECIKKSDGSTRVSFHYPKFKNGEAVVKDIRVAQKFEYVDEVFETVLDVAQSSKLAKTLQDELASRTPPPLSSQFGDRTSHEEALRKRESRLSMETSEVPPTADPDTIGSQNVTAQDKTRRAPHCRVCKQPMKGHKYVVNCPKNN